MVVKKKWFKFYRISYQILKWFTKILKNKTDIIKVQNLL